MQIVELAYSPMVKRILQDDEEKRTRSMGKFSIVDILENIFDKVVFLVGLFQFPSFSPIQTV